MGFFAVSRASCPPCPAPAVPKAGLQRLAKLTGQVDALAKQVTALQSAVDGVTAQLHRVSVAESARHASPALQRAVAETGPNLGYMSPETGMHVVSLSHMLPPGHS
eukprot:TRINITY_DN64972_c0_g1_i1.p3 TRINITY_DN64972_c0_g1~~TRINITY_DN64972_c0_g1_i1.p3  ORF type:complete len:106 (+),score=18.40 TRINITY_DN64972_c0_g1_i1:130-447(+)